MQPWSGYDAEQEHRGFAIRILAPREQVVISHLEDPDREWQARPSQRPTAGVAWRPPYSASTRALIHLRLLACEPPDEDALLAVGGCLRSKYVVVPHFEYLQLRRQTQFARSRAVRPPAFEHRHALPGW